MFHAIVIFPIQEIELQSQKYSFNKGNDNEQMKKNENIIPRC